MAGRRRGARPDRGHGRRRRRTRCSRRSAWCAGSRPAAARSSAPCSSTLASATSDAHPRSARRRRGARAVCDRRRSRCRSPSTATSRRSPADAVEFTLEPGRPLTVVLTAADRGPLTHVAPDAAWRALVEDEARWRRWSARHRLRRPVRRRCRAQPHHPAAAHLLALRGAGGGADDLAARTARRGAQLGLPLRVAPRRQHRHRRLPWRRARRAGPRLPVLAAARQPPRPAPPAARCSPCTEGGAARTRALDWPGYADSRPVRFGNGARDQHQLDNYGWVLDAMWLLVRAGHRLYGETWRTAMALADHVADRWREPDAGLWEVRGEPAHHVHSKLMAWLALDRALRLAETHRTSADAASPVDDRARRDRRRRPRPRCRPRPRGTFVRAYGRRDLDAALLVLPLLGLEAPDSPLVVGTVEAVRRELSAGGPLLYRYPPGDDGLAGDEGAFLPCSFWLVQALAATGAVDECDRDDGGPPRADRPARALRRGGRPHYRGQLGNYPQAFTHATLVQAALAIRDATKGRAGGPARSRTRHERAS